MEESFAPNQLSFILKKKLVDMSSGKNEKQKYELITRNLQEVLGADRLKQFIETSKEPLKLYWGTATTGRPHIAYFLPITKIGDFLRAGCQVTILLADLHAYLDNMKAPWRLLSLRTRYYEHIIKSMLRSIKVPIEKLKFVKGTEYQLSQEYTLDVYKISSIVTEHDAKKAGSEVVKQVQNPLLSGLLYPCLQALDEHYLNVDAQFGGVDQRKIFTLAEKYLPAIGYSKRIHLMNPMVPGLTGTKMSASEEDSKIDLLDSPTVVARKIKRAFCEPGNIENNGLLPFVRYVIFPVFEQIDEHGFRVKRPEKFGGDVVYGSYEELEASFAKQDLHPGDLKLAVASYINRLLAPIIAEFQSPELNELKEKAYEQTGAFPKTSEEIAGSLKATVVQPTVEPFVLDLRVGRIISAREHPNANSLYVEEIDVGEEAPRTVISGLVPYMTIDQLTEAPEHREHSYCVVLCNCKPLRMKEIESQGLLLIAYSDEKPKNKVAEIIRPPEGAKPGDRIWFEGYHQNDGHHRSYTFTELNPKKKVWESIRSDLRTDNKGIVRWRGSAMRTIEGTIAVHKLINAPIK